jgi:predicted RNA-binding protein with PIN domain
MTSDRSFVRGLFEAVSMVALFIAGGLGWAAVLGGGAQPAGSAAPALYFPDVEEPPPSPRVWLVDGYNVLNVGLLAGRPREGWWSSRFRDELMGRVAGFEEPDAEIWVVFDGARPPHTAQAAEGERSSDERAGRVRPVFAPSADEWLLAQIRERGAGRVALVTADRSLADRARHRGAEVVAPAEFLARCRALG